MDLTPPSTTAQWRGFLQTYSTEFLDSEFFREIEAEGRGLYCADESQQKAGWLGFAPAAEHDVAAAEQRLGVRLPPSYRNFLLATDGFSTISYSVDLLSAKQIDWFRELEAELVDCWRDLDHFADQMEILERLVLISNDDGGAGHYLMLDSGAVAENGEWAAYEWWPGDGDDPEPYENFAVLVTELWRNAS
jgi:hypothetical protein